MKVLGASLGLIRHNCSFATNTMQSPKSKDLRQGQHNLLVALGNLEKQIAPDTWIRWQWGMNHISSSLLCSQHRAAVVLRVVYIRTLHRRVTR